MKAMPMRDLVDLLTKYEENTDIIFSDTVERLFTRYGDTYYLSEYNHTKAELSMENEDRKELLKILHERRQDGKSQEGES